MRCKVSDLSKLRHSILYPTAFLMLVLAASFVLFTLVSPEVDPEIRTKKSVFAEPKQLQKVVRRTRKSSLDFSASDNFSSSSPIEKTNNSVPAKVSQVDLPKSRLMKKKHTKTQQILLIVENLMKV